MAHEADAADPGWELLARVAAGDAEAFAPLVACHQERLLRLCERLLGEAEEARDAAQEVLLKAFRKAGGYRPRGQVYTWLYRIAVNHCLNLLRRRRVVRFLRLGDGADEDAEPPLDPADARADPETAPRHRGPAAGPARGARPGALRGALLPPGGGGAGDHRGCGREPAGAGDAPPGSGAGGLDAGGPEMTGSRGRATEP